MVPKRVFLFLNYLLIGIIIGFISNLIFFQYTTTSDTRPSAEHSIEIDASLAVVKKIRILCLINTNPANHYRALHIRETWGRYCDKLIFASTITNVNLEIIGFNTTDSHDFLWTKEAMMMQYVYKNYWHRYDWFYKADDDTFAVIENLRYLLTAYSTENPIFIGYKFFTPVHRWGYTQGGAGKTTPNSHAFSYNLFFSCANISLMMPRLCDE